MRNKRKTLFSESAMMNTASYDQYLVMLTEMAISLFEWKNLPSTVNARYMELKLFENGSVVYFNDDVIGDLCLDVITSGSFNVYGDPILRRAYSNYNNYQKLLKETNSVIVWNNYLHTNSIVGIRMFARRLANYDRIIDVNANAQKTPVLVQSTEKQRLTMLNLYKEYEGNAPFIFGDKSLDLTGLKVLQTGAPYVADKIYQLKKDTWNEALTYLGISNVSYQKKERMITDEVARMQGGTVASRFSRLDSRRQGARAINEMFGTNIEVEYREDVSGSYGGSEDESGGDVVE